jgi:hypothetical protein
MRSITVSSQPSSIQFLFVPRTSPLVASNSRRQRTISHVRAINRRVNAVRGKFPPLDDEFPGSLDRLIFEIIGSSSCRASRKTRGDTCQVRGYRGRCACRQSGCILGVGGASGFVGTRPFAKEDRYELVYASVGEKQVRRAGQRKCGNAEPVRTNCL